MASARRASSSASAGRPRSSSTRARLQIASSSTVLMLANRGLRATKGDERYEFCLPLPYRYDRCLPASSRARGPSVEEFIFDDDVDEVGAETEAHCPKCKA